MSTKLTSSTKITKDVYSYHASPFKGWLVPLFVSLLVTAGAAEAILMGFKERLAYLLLFVTVGSCLAITAPEILLAVYIFIGAFKETDVLSRFAIDPTLGIALLLILGIVWQRKGQLKYYRLPKVICCYGGLTLYSFISLIHSSAPVSGLKKSIYLASFSLVALLSGYYLLKTERSVRRFFISIIVISVVLSTAVLTGALSGTVKPHEFRYGAFESSAIFLGYSCGLSLLILAFFRRKALSYYQLLHLPLLVILILGAVFSGTRGVLVYSTIAFGIGSLYSFRVYSKDVFKRLVFVIFLSIAIFFITTIIFSPLKDVIQAPFHRILSVVKKPPQSLESREPWFTTAWAMIKTSPLLGHGAGSFATFFHGRDVWSYPHNIFLELWSELGFVGLSLFLLLLIVTIKRVPKMFKNHANIQIPLTILALFIYVMGSMMTNYIFYADRSLWTFIGLMLGYEAQTKYKEPKQ